MVSNMREMTCCFDRRSGTKTPTELRGFVSISWRAHRATDSISSSKTECCSLVTRGFGFLFSKGNWAALGPNASMMRAIAGLSCRNPTNKSLPGLYAPDRIQSGRRRQMSLRVIQPRSRNSFPNRRCNCRNDSESLLRSHHSPSTGKCHSAIVLAAFMARRAAPAGSKTLRMHFFEQPAPKLYFLRR